MTTIMELINALGKREKEYGDAISVTANKINNISFLVLKDSQGKVVDCIILEDKRYNSPKEDLDND